MPERRAEALLMVPAFVERLEDEDEIVLFESVQMGDCGIQLVDEILLFVFV